MSLFLIDAGTSSDPSAERIRLISSELGRRGYSYSVVGFERSAALEGNVLGAQVRRFSLGKGPSFMFKSRLTRLLAKHKPGLIHIIGTNRVGDVLAAAGKAGVPVKVMSLRQGESSSSFRPLAGSLDGVFVASEGMKDVVVRGGFPSGNVEIVPPVIDFSCPQEDGGEGALRSVFHFGQNDFLVGIVGHLADQKTHGIILDAAASIAQRVPDVRLIILGDGDLTLESPGLPCPPKPGNIYYCLGRDSDVPRIVGSLDAFVMYSHLEGLGMKIVRAMAWGVPVIAADIRGVPEALVHRTSGLLVPPRDAEALKEAVLKLYFDKAFAARLGQAGKDAAEAAYSDRAVAARIVGFYERLAAVKRVSLA